MSTTASVMQDGAAPDNGARAQQQQDWAIIWTSEANALAVDPEMAEAVARTLHLWAAMMTLHCSSFLLNDAAGAAAAPSSPGSPPPAASPCGG